MVWYLTGVKSALFRPSFKHLVYLKTKSCDTTKTSLCGWFDIYTHTHTYIYIYIYIHIYMYIYIFVFILRMEKKDRNLISVYMYHFWLITFSPFLSIPFSCFRKIGDEYFHSRKIMRSTDSKNSQVNFPTCGKIKLIFYSEIILITHVNSHLYTYLYAYVERDISEYTIPW